MQLVSQYPEFREAIVNLQQCSPRFASWLQTPINPPYPGPTPQLTELLGALVPKRRLPGCGAFRN
ncbi:hypothetical protein [Gallaecimonas pentaromativorans]|uniref:Uncharacterized protein n=1 Tax=Gallaecimonas pentaromativorans TaxID=584787 RepID=A0A3N1PNN0_9GAMM|nr:hypothetical protein [Gallaecimonas pentaromativorans]ROQ29769.1 hypothetical protein EDC28_102141 [Gallaecimonas pentaromativorans]